MVINTAGGKAFIEESVIVSVIPDDFEDKSLWLSTSVGFNPVKLIFNTREEAIEVAEKLINNIPASSGERSKEAQFVEGFKEGVEYALKLEKVER